MPTHEYLCIEDELAERLVAIGLVLSKRGFPDADRILRIAAGMVWVQLGEEIKARRGDDRRDLTNLKKDLAKIRKKLVCVPKQFPIKTHNKGDRVI